MKNLVLLSIFLFSHLCALDKGTQHNYCTVADEKHYPLLINLIGSIHKNDFHHLDEIAVFDIGLTADQRNTLNRISKVRLCHVEQKHPDMLTPFLTVNWGKAVRGWYSWKPVLMKQALDMYPYYFYIDAGSLVLNSPDMLFKHIQQKGYFFIDVSHNIVDRMTLYVQTYFLPKFSPEQQQIICDPKTFMVAGGVQGLSRYIYFDYIFPIYLIAGNLDYFVDDGSARLGFGSGRHDQTLMSMMVRSRKYQTMSAEGWSKLTVDEKTVPFHYHWDPKSVIPDQTTIFSCRWDFTYSGEMPSHIRWK